MFKLETDTFTEISRAVPVHFTNLARPNFIDCCAADYLFKVTRNNIKQVRNSG